MIEIRIDQLLKAHGRTFYWLAKETGISPTTLWRLKKGKALGIISPCVTGPYAGVNCTLTLLKSSIRKTQNLSDREYARENAEDDRFSDYFGSLQSIVTSSAQNDSGLFETNLRDERYLPFENSGVVSEWLLELPADPSKKDPTQMTTTQSAT